jgi:putative spermidine/putrescine transport system ATP-binding protein|tara:strand:- start:3361 stop:4350 length:990 start_codon:yes stop_codon:yes gene_type:complete
MTLAVELKNISKIYDNINALKNVNLKISDGEFFSLLGPSGSGKTTCLKIIAGFEQANQGYVYLFGDEVSNVPPYKRKVNTVFQDYALFPHMSVGQNIGYSLKIRNISKTEQQQQVKEILEIVKLSGYEDRRTNQLSGGQKQRVALARSLINKPKVLLLDEPLGALDLKLREQMQVELKVLQRQFNITFIYVTHDQQEALSMSDRIAVFNEGNIEQVDTPANIYLSPKSSFIANFVGTTNVINKDIASNNFKLTKSFSIRPENISIIKSDKNYDYNCSGSVIESQFQGSLYKIILKTSFNQQFIINSKQPYEINSNIKFGWFEKDIIIFD